MEQILKHKFLFFWVQYTSQNHFWTFKYRVYHIFFLNVDFMVIEIKFNVQFVHKSVNFSWRRTLNLVKNQSLIQRVLFCVVIAFFNICAQKRRFIIMPVRKKCKLCLVRKNFCAVNNYIFIKGIINIWNILFFPYLIYTNVFHQGLIIF